MPERQDFLKWLSGAYIYIGYDRYAQFGYHGFVVASQYYESDELKKYINDLNSDDVPALKAFEKLKDMKYCIGLGKDPSFAMQILVDGLRKSYLEGTDITNNA